MNIHTDIGRRYWDLTSDERLTTGIGGDAREHTSDEIRFE
jgi:hypothetical protein